MNFQPKNLLSTLAKHSVLRRNRRRSGRPMTSKSLRMEQLEQRAMMAGLAAAGAEALASLRVDADTDLQAALVGEQLADDALGRVDYEPPNITPSPRTAVDRVGIAPLPSPHPRPVDAVARVGVLPLSTSFPNPQKLPVGDDPIGIEPTPSPHPRPVDAVTRVGVLPLPTSFPNPQKLPVGDDPIGIAPVPSPHPRPVDAVMRVGLAPLPSP